ADNCIDLKQIHERHGWIGPAGKPSVISNRLPVSAFGRREPAKIIESNLRARLSCHSAGNFRKGVSQQPVIQAILRDGVQLLFHQLQRSSDSYAAREGFRKVNLLEVQAYWIYRGEPANSSRKIQAAIHRLAAMSLQINHNARSGDRGVITSPLQRGQSQGRQQHVIDLGIKCRRHSSEQRLSCRNWQSEPQAARSGNAISAGIEPDSRKKLSSGQNALPVLELA